MKKIMTIVLAIMILLMTFAGCGAKNPVPADEQVPETIEEETTDEGHVYFSELKYDSEKGTLHYVIQNDSDETVSVGGDVMLEMRAIDGLWVDVMPLEWNSDEVKNGPIVRIITIDPGQSLEGEIIISSTFGELSDGEYRATLEIATERGSETISGTFTVAPMR